MKILRLVLSVVVILVGWNLLAVHALGSDVYHGRVVDEETCEPLEGASVTVIWYRVPVVYMDRVRSFQSAQETVTDADGKFSLEVSPGIDWNPFTTILKENDVVIYNPGYRPFAPGLTPKELWDLNNFVAAFKKGVTIKLTKLKTKEEFREFASVGSLLIRAPFAEIPNLIRDINIQSKMAGLQPYK